MHMQDMKCTMAIYDAVQFREMKTEFVPFEGHHCPRLHACMEMKTEFLPFEGHRCACMCVWVYIYKYIIICLDYSMLALARNMNLPWPSSGCPPTFSGCPPHDEDDIDFECVYRRGVSAVWDYLHCMYSQVCVYMHTIYKYAVLAGVCVRVSTSVLL